MFYLSSREHFAENPGKKHKPKNTQFNFTSALPMGYFSEVCVVFSRLRIAFPKNVEVKHTIYFDWPYRVSYLTPATLSLSPTSKKLKEILYSLLSELFDPLKG